MKKLKVHRNLTGSVIQRLRMEAVPKITQEDLAARLARFGIELTQVQVAKLENGTRPIFDYEVLAISKALRVPVQALFGELTKSR